MMDEMNTLQIQTVLYHNNKTSLLRSLSSFGNAIDVNRRTTNELGKVVIVYGDASSAPIFKQADIDKINEQNKARFTLKYIFFHENTGTSRGHNKMFSECESEYVLLMNPDIIPAPRFFHHMLRVFHLHGEKAGAVEARQVPIEHPKEYDPDTFETAWGSGACTMVRSKVFQEIGGYDEKTFFMYCDDVDCSWRIRLAGYHIYYCPDAPIYHSKKLSLEGRLESTDAEKYYSAEAALLLNYKYSNIAQCKELMDMYLHSGDADYLKAVEHFKELKRSGNLPEQLDSEHKVATFIDGQYAKHRFAL